MCITFDVVGLDSRTEATSIDFPLDVVVVLLKALHEAVEWSYPPVGTKAQQSAETYRYLGACVLLKEGQNTTLTLYECSLCTAVVTNEVEHTKWHLGSG